MCWAAGKINNSFTDFEFEFTPFWFLTPPYQFIRSHFPSNPLWQLLAQPHTMAQFARSGPQIAQAGCAMDFEVLSPQTVSLKSRSTYACTVPLPRLSRLNSGRRNRISIRIGLPSRSTQTLCYWSVDSSMKQIGQLKTASVPPNGEITITAMVEAPPSGRFVIGFMSGNSGTSVASFLVS